jgi:ectoine hydroxylase-related dioxygenase (phytanoyl-CoA dioxygenase family)
MISQQLIEQYEQDGVVYVERAVDPREVDQLLSHIDALIADPEQRWTTNREGGFSDRHLWPTHPWMYDFCAGSALPELAAGLMRSNSARLFFDHTFVRSAGTSHATPWHQDQPYWPFQGRQIISMWVALTASDASSSGLRFVKGSHRWNKTFQPVAFSASSAAFLSGNDSLEPMPDFDAPSAAYEILSWAVEPGDALVFSADAVHGALANNDAEHRRAALSVRYVGDDAIWDPRPGTDPIVTEAQVSVAPGELAHDDRWFPVVWPDAAQHR